MEREPDITSLVPGFLEELGARIDRIERDVTALTTPTDSAPLINRIVAEFHTIKGSASCLELADLAEAAHHAEEVVERWRVRSFAPAGEAPDMRTIDALRASITRVRAIRAALTCEAPGRNPGVAPSTLRLRDVLEHHAALVRARAAGRACAAGIRIECPADLAIPARIASGLYPVLLHTLNNCIDHASQPPRTRRAAGKADAISITISARRRSDGALALSIADDGPGLDIDAIARRAAAPGRAPSPATPLDPETIQAILLQPGFTTAKHPSIRAGRGVGLEAVRLAISELGGSVRILSTPGVGATLTFLIPGLNHPDGMTDTGSESAKAA